MLSATQPSLAQYGQGAAGAVVIQNMNHGMNAKNRKPSACTQLKNAPSDSKLIEECRKEQYFSYWFSGILLVFCSIFFMVLIFMSRRDNHFQNKVE